MPNYDYSCEKCSTEFEVNISFEKDLEKEKVKCPKCNSIKTKRKIKKAHSVFYNVEGFYSSDNRRYDG